MMIGVLTCLWKREALARLMLAHTASLRDELHVEGIDLELLAVGSEGADVASYVHHAGWYYHYAPNDPRGAKWNAGAEWFVKSSWSSPITYQVPFSGRRA